MSIKKKITEPGLYFITFTCFQWLPLIEVTNSYDLFYSWFKILKQKGHKVIGYVIMPNHIHLLLYRPEYFQSLNTVVGNGKRFIGYELVKRLRKIENKFYLAQLKIAVEDADKFKGQHHNIWEDSFDVKQCRTKDFFLQKLNYTHNNPCSKIWRLSNTPKDYTYSSASFYHSSQNKNDLITHYDDLSLF